jgi:acetate kinase
MILTINAGSTSLKYALFDARLKELSRGEFDNETINEVLFQKITADLALFLTSTQTLLCVAHRVVHGGRKYKKPIKISQRILNELKKLAALAPLHNPFNIKGIELAQKFFSNAKQYAVFDTGFFADLPEQARVYPIPFSKYTEDHIQKYGFHGISHQYALLNAQKKLKIKSPNLITIHLGGGCSITAIKKGKPIDTSMGYSPMEGLMMWSRTGDIDPYLVGKFGLNEHTLNHESGIKGISGCNDYLDLIKKYKQGEKRAVLAMDMFTYRIQKYIGAYYAALQGKVDAIVFTGKIGAGEALTRKRILKNLPFLLRTKKIILQANEEWMMAKSI